ncbi:hypothetical protein BCEN4_330049 [Burkholderia cenocepacia]|nr:hypothetical protein BCEN4_330049 [Burkholderia cenocepacia]
MKGPAAGSSRGGAKPGVNRFPPSSPRQKVIPVTSQDCIFTFNVILLSPVATRRRPRARGAPISRKRRRWRQSPSSAATWSTS